MADNGIEITNQKEILNEQMRFYQKLYTSNKTNVNPSDFLEEDKMPKLSENHKIMCDNPLTIEECGTALSKLENNKSPGSDGLTTNFYKFFWTDIKDIVYESYIYSQNNGSLSMCQKMGILNLAPKEGKDLRLLKNWRPITVLNTDYKILTKALATRLQKLIASLIDPDQVGYISGRYIYISFIAFLMYININIIEIPSTNKIE